jgi:hypothetical protein
MLVKRIFMLALLSTLFLCFSIASDKKKEPEKFRQNELQKMLNDCLNKSNNDLVNMNNWVFSEAEVFINETHPVKINGKNSAATIYVPSFRKEYNWFMKDGAFVRSPTTINGTTVDQAQRTAAEAKWIKEEKGSMRQKSLLEFVSDFLMYSLIAVRTEPLPNLERWKRKQFEQISSAGQFAYGGEKIDEGHKVIEIQYLTKESVNPSVYRLEFFILPEEHQIIRMNMIKANDASVLISLIMDKWDGNVWLPRKFTYVFRSDDGLELKGNYFHAREFHSFAKANVNANITFEEIDNKKEDGH